MAPLISTGREFGESFFGDNNVQSKVTRRGDTLSFQYDTLNRRCSKAIATTPTSCSATSSGNPTVWYSYDLDNHLIAANDNSATVVIPTSAAGYSTSLTYDTVNNPATASWTPAPLQTFSSSASVTFQDVYDANGRRTSQTATNNSWLSYPAATASSLTYNVNALNQYTCIFSSTCSVTLLYDGNGNLTYDGTFTYGYDAESRLTSILNGATTVATYAYDSLDRRKSKTVGSTTTNYVNDADNREVLEYNGSSGAQQNWYAYGLGSNDVLNQMNVAANTRETMVPDIQGSMIATLDASSGTLTNAGYQPFGENPSVTSGTFRYTGQRFDPETAGSASEPSGLYYYRSRMYSPTLGRFPQPDPGGYQASGMNLYAYVNNSPINWGDPYGLAQDGPTTVYTSAGQLLGDFAGGIGNAAAQTATNLAYDILDVGSLGGLSQDFSGPPQAQPFSVANSYVASEGAATFQGVSAVAGGMSLGEGLGAIDSAAIDTNSGILFAQQGISSTFRNGEFAGQSIYDVAAGLQNGSISADQLPLNVINFNGSVYTLNNRSLMALQLAGQAPTIVNDVSGNAFFESQLIQRLNEIGPSVGPNFVPVIRGQ
jgi:RHS repeat-associated protein